jgi:hypothetical protein
MCVLLLAQFFVCTFFGVDYVSSAISSCLDKVKAANQAALTPA